MQAVLSVSLAEVDHVNKSIAHTYVWGCFLRKYSDSCSLTCQKFIGIQQIIIFEQVSNFSFTFCLCRKGLQRGSQKLLKHLFFFGLHGLIVRANFSVG